MLSAIAIYFRGCSANKRNEMRRTDLLCYTLILVFSLCTAFIVSIPSEKILMPQLNPQKGASIDWLIAGKKSSPHVKKLLMIGDSMFEGLAGPLNDFFEASGIETNTIVWYGSNTKCWCRNDTLKTILEKENPDFVLFSCGSNELLIPAIYKHTTYISKIKEYLRAYNHIWVGPPNWKDDTGINRIIDSVSNHSDFFLSANLPLPRYKDGAHPNKEGNIIWADSLVEWINSTPNGLPCIKRPQAFTYKQKNYHIIPISSVNAKSSI